MHTAALYGKTGLTRTVGGGVVGVSESGSVSASMPLSLLLYTTNGVRALCLVENLENL